MISILGNTLLHNIEVNYRGGVKTATYREGDYKVNHIYLQKQKAVTCAWLITYFGNFIFGFFVTLVV